MGNIVEYVAPSLDDIFNYSRVSKAFKNVLCKAPFKFQCDIYSHNKFFFHQNFSIVYLGDHLHGPKEFPKQIWGPMDDSFLKNIFQQILTSSVV